MKRIKNEEGYGLLFAIGLLLIISILGMGLMGLSLNGAKRTEARENIVQSGDLSTKGIEHIEKEVQTELVDSLGASGMSVDNFKIKLEEVLNKYKCDQGNSINSENLTTGRYETCIESYKDFKTTVEGVEIANPLKKEVTFKSIGTTGTKEEVIKSTITFGAQSFPEVLKYAIGTNKDSTRCNTNTGAGCGNGNLILNGGVNIEGDMKVDGHLITSNSGVIGSVSGSTGHLVPSVLPQVSGVKSNRKSRLILGGKSYDFRQKYPNYTTFNYQQHVRGTNISNTSFYRNETNLNNLFFNDYGPEIIRTEPKDNSVEITEEREKYYFNQNTSNRLNLGSSGTIRNRTGTTVSPSTTEQECISQGWFGCNRWGEYIFTFNGNNNFEKMSLTGKSTFSSTNTTFKQTAYFGGDVIIGNTTTNQTSLSDVTLEGKIYVDGDLTINNAKLTSNTIFYVDGDVNIKFSTIEGKRNQNSNIAGSLIIFATGNISLSNNSENKPTPSHIKGYFYSEKDMEIYGVGSNIKVEGGLSARRIVLNAVRGEASRSRSNITTERINGSYYFESSNIQKTLARERSRLQVIYDSDIIESYLGLVDSEPWIDSIEDPVVIDRK